jgi:NADH-quinone oxidoreductase subunit J
MIIPTLFFYLFAVLAVLASITVIAANNAVHSVLALIVTFFAAAGIFILLGAELVAMTLVIVYVGAVAVLFLFVVMMLDIRYQPFSKKHLPSLIVGLIVGGGLLLNFLLIYKMSLSSPAMAKLVVAAPELTDTNTHMIGRVLYTDYIYAFQTAGIILLVAMIGAMMLTLRHRKSVKSQNIAKQLARTRAQGVTLVSIPLARTPPLAAKVDI